jgi:ribonuclease HI
MARERFYAIRYKDGRTEIEFGNWYVVQEKILGVSNIIYKGFDRLCDAQSWLEQKPVPFRKVDDLLVKDKLYIFVDGSYMSNPNMSGWGWVAVINDEKIGEDFGIVKNKNLLVSRNISGELCATMEAADWYAKNIYPKYLKPIIVHDYTGIANWVLGYWTANKKVSIEYCNHMFQYVDYFDFEKIDGHTNDKWNDYADKLASRGYEEFSSKR